MASLQPQPGLLGKRLAAHLLRRCTFQYTKARIEAFANKTPAAAVAELFVIPDHYLDEPIDLKTNDHWINTGSDPVSFRFLLRTYVIGWWVDEARRDPSISHKLAFFFHSIFVVSADFTFPSELYDYLALIRKYAIGNIKTLAEKITLDQAMMHYLNGDRNTKFFPNENYAREFFELFTIGKGEQIGPENYTNYTEADIVMAAKLLTGWRTSTRIQGGDPSYLDPDTNLQQGYPFYHWHDETDKTFSSAFNNQVITGAVNEADMGRELKDFIEMVFGQTETAKNYCRKLYRYFVSAKITTEIENDIISPLAQLLITNDYNVQPVLQILLTSKHFYDTDDSNATDEIIGALVKSPLEVLLQALSFFDISVPDPVADTVNHYHYWIRETVDAVVLNRAGMTLYRPESVAGYPAYFQEPGWSENWFNGSTIIARYKLAEILLTGNRILSNGPNGGVQLDFAAFIRDTGVVSNPEDGTALVTELTTYLFPEIPKQERLDYFLQEIFLDNLSLINWKFEWRNFINTGDDSAVKIPLEMLFIALLSSQEFQLM